MQINERLNLVIPLYRDDDADAYAHVHATPISRAVFEANFLLLSKAFAALHAEGLGNISGPRVAALMLKDVGGEKAETLMAEFRRLSNVIVPGQNGWEVLPFDDAVTRKAIDEDDASEVLNGIAFFMLGWHGYPRKTRQAMLEGAASLWGAQLSSQTSTDLAASLRISIADANGGEMKGPTIQKPGQAARPFSLPS